ncbi:(d)CMP kinase [Arenibaculum pallidiluteum]|uniref:(d)CMP kinase n=1 Tax=Arenibaculum pallidiluteum TaxID=2812559 RepID=UPI001A96B1FA|nr:(d)CMP kinase [Arenibaculum pallidiluteum]
MKAVVIAIDGPAASGKGTLARRVSDRLGFAHLDTGALYRAVGLLTARRGGDPADPAAAEAAARALDAQQLAELMKDPELRGDWAAQAASQVGAVPGVRAALMDFQRGFAARPPGGGAGAVLDGRDIGTVVCPDAPAKLFVTAAVDVRARRRFNELLARGVPAIYDAVLADMKERDARDSQRAVAPLRPAVDAFLLDTSSLDADAAFEAALSFIRSKTGLPA